MTPLPRPHTLQLKGHAARRPRPQPTRGQWPGGPGCADSALWFPGASRVNLVRIPSTASSPRDTALAAVICSALATVLLALIILCVIYCKRQFMEKKPSCKSRAPSVS